MRTCVAALVMLCLLASFAPAVGQTYAAPGDPQEIPGRAVSLRVLQGRLRACEPTGTCPDAILKLAGLTRLIGYVTDDVLGDIILVGEADPSAPSLHLEDLVVAFRNARMDYAELRGYTYYYSNPGCSIDPDPQVIATLGEVGRRIFSALSESEIERGIADWKRVCRSPQEVAVFGIPFNTRFARVMVDADYDMKGLVDGSDSLSVPGFSSLTDMILAIAKRDMLAGRTPSIPATSMNRFWFHPGGVGYREDEGVKVIEECPVVLLTEEEHLSKTGSIAGTGRADPLAAEFARDFTTHYQEIAAERPIYRELENLFAIVALAKLMETDGVLGGTPLDLSYLLGRYQIPETPVDTTLAGRANVKRFSVRRDYAGGYSIAKMWIPSCGGVAIDIEATSGNILPDTTGRLARLRAVVLEMRPGADALSWTFRQT